MIPISLSIKGLYSYQSTRQTIDFAQMTSAQVFGIFGKTGSGKSSILEAISYALYGESERLNRQDKRGYNMMNLKSDELDIDFIFDAGNKRYRYTVNGKRSNKHFEKVGTLERAAFVYEAEAWAPIPIDSTEEIIGLSYENFKRTIIIPQGKFQEFLQLTETDRTRMLREIFNLGKFELYQRTSQLDKKNGLSIARQESLFQQLAAVHPEAVAAVAQRVQESEAAYAEMQTQVEKKSRTLKKMEALHEQFIRLEKQRTEWKTLQGQVPAIQAREASLNQYEVCLIDFKPLIDRQAEVVQQSEKAKNTLLAKREALERATRELRRFEDMFKEVQTQYANREQLRQKAEELESIISLKELQVNINGQNRRIQDGNKFITEAQQEITKLKDQLRESGKKIKALRESLQGLDELLRIRDFFVKKKALEEEATRARKRRESIQESLERWEAEKIGLLKESRLSPAQYKLPVDKLMGIVQGESQQTTSAIQEIAKRVQSISNAAHMASFAEKLEAGEPCPLCGSLHHPNPVAVENLPFQLEEARSAAANLEIQREQWQRVGLRLEGLERQRISLGQDLAGHDAEWKEISGKTDQHQAGFIWEQYRNKTADDVQQEIDGIHRKNKEIEAINTRLEAIDGQISNEEKKRETYTRAIEKIQAERQLLEVNLKAGKQSLRQIEFDEWQKQDNLKIEQAAVDERKRYKEVADLYQTCEQQIRQLRSNSDILRGEIAGLEKQEQENTRQLVRINQQINQRLEASGYERIQVVTDILNQELNIESEKKVLSQFRQQLHAAETKLRELEAEVAGKNQDTVAYEALKLEIEELKEKSHALGREIGGQRGEWQRLLAELTRKQEIGKELDRLRLREENLRTLKNMFARSGFVNYVSTIYLHNLCLAANERFRKLTRGVLSMEATENNSFQIRDFLNNGQTRSVKTLSGGQTFQAALSLALALADQVQQQAKSQQNFFFIDEGFGSQDRESLQTIFQTLKSLRHENRIVGVISHVEELQQEIDTYLHIQNDPEQGSLVRSSWE